MSKRERTPLLVSAKSLSSNVHSQNHNGSNYRNHREDDSPKTTTTTPTARQAYQAEDVEASRRYHDSKEQCQQQLLSSASSSAAAAGMASSEEGHQKGGDLLKPIIFGGLDGILTSFAIVAGAAGGQLPARVTLILGVSNIIADALSMGVGAFLSDKATNEWILSERAREEWELEHYPQGEVREMIDIYVNKGMRVADAEVVVTTMAQYKDFFVDIMMAQELELQVPEEHHVQESMKEGCIMFLSFAGFGLLPLLGYVAVLLVPSSWGEWLRWFPHFGNDNELFVSACVVTGLVLFGLGSIKSWFCSTQHWIRSGLETLLLGGACATVAYTVGQLVSQMLVEQDGETDGT